MVNIQIFIYINQINGYDINQVCESFCLAESENKSPEFYGSGCF